MVLFATCTLLIGYIYFQELRHSRNLALTDPLTSLHNRFALFEKSKKLLAEEREFTVYLLDLNGFKAINDTYGHRAGDKVLSEVAERLNTLTNFDSTPYRIGGDEFAIILQGCTDHCAQEFNCQLEALFSSPFLYHKQQLNVSTSLGSAVYPADSTNIDELMMLADQRMYQMKVAQSS
jgi:diguanylate cyclase (GGDEF)-like protein